MKSIKPGRGPSMMGGIGSVFSVIFGIFWTIFAVQMEAPFFFPIFGVIFVLVGIVQAVYNFTNAAGENRFSEYDITEDGEEPDPLDKAAKKTSGQEEQIPAHSGEGFCPYCGTAASRDYVYCPKCGKLLPGRKA